MAIDPAGRPGDAGSDESVGPLILDTIRAELADERTRGDSLQSRALTLSAGSAAATALVFGLGSDYSGRWETLFFSLLAVAGLLFLAAAGSSWWSVRLLDYKQLDLPTLRELMEEEGDPEVDDLHIYVATGLMTTLEDAREQNTVRADRLEQAFGAFLLGAMVVGLELLIVVGDQVLP